MSKIIKNIESLKQVKGAGSGGGTEPNYKILTGGGGLDPNKALELN